MNKTILVVDDEPEVCEILVEKLKLWGYETLGAASVKECLELLQKTRPDLILLDILMPEIDGINGLKEIKKEYEDIPIIMVTAIKDIVAMHDSALFGAFEYITKPIDDAKLQASIDRALTDHEE